MRFMFERSNHSVKAFDVSGAYAITNGLFQR
jgi:hypothetical protein